MGGRTVAAGRAVPSSAEVAAASAAGAAAIAPGWGIALVVAAALWLVLPALHAPFFADDYLFLDQVHGHSLISALGTPDPLSNFFRPVSRQIYFWLIGRASGESSQAFHAVNIASFLGLVSLMFLLVRRMVGARAGIIAAGFVALHYSADVPVLWACGSQDLLAALGAVGATLLHLIGRRVLAALALLLAVLSKEVALVAPLIIVAADHREEERWTATARRAWPLLAAMTIWFLLWIAMPHLHAAEATYVGINAGSPLAALAHLPKVVLGLEWWQGETARLPWGTRPWISIALVLVAVAGAWPWPAGVRHGRQRSTTGTRGVPPNREAPPTGSGHRHAIRVGLLWSLLATAPVTASVNLWSAYYYLFAICGVALALGAWLASVPRGWAMLATGAIALSSASARGIEEFAGARGVWTRLSHINRFYITRATHHTERYLADLKRMHPSFPPGSTLFFSGVKGNIGFLVGDGPLQRSVYRDPSLRAYFLSELTLERARRGPLFFFLGSKDTLGELAPGPGLFSDIAAALIMNDLPRAARDALLLELERDPAAPGVNYRLAWVQWELGEQREAHAALEAAGVRPAEGPSPEVTQALAAFQTGDTLAAIQIMTTAVAHRGLDPGAHALLADLKLALNPADAAGTIEAFAARVLAPEEPSTWRRWGMVQAHGERYLQAISSFERYFALAGEQSRDDREARRWVATIRGMLPGGDLAREGPREERVSEP